MKLKAGQTLLFIGDSITDAGRVRPVGEESGLGTGYVSLVSAMLDANCPELRVRVLNTGISGNRIIDLDARWQTDVLDLRPDWLAVMIGINDVWRRFDRPKSQRQVLVDEYREVYLRLMSSVRGLVKGIVIMPPYYLETDRKDSMRRMMDQYGAVAREVAGKCGAVFADVQAGFDAFLKHNPTQMLCGDRVHPNLTGHMIIARTFLDAIGMTWKVAR